MITHKVLVLLYDVEFKRQVIEDGIKTIQQWLTKSTNGELKLEVDFLVVDNTVFESSHSDVDAGGIGMVKDTVIINPNQIAQYGLAIEAQRNTNYDVVCLLANPDSVKPERPKIPVHYPIFTDGFTVIQILIFPAHETYAFGLTFIHELLHAWYYLVNKRGNLALKDDVHAHSAYDDPRPQFGYLDILTTLKPNWALLQEYTYMQPDRDLSKINPTLRALVEEFLKRAKFGEWEAFVTEGFRSNDRQNWLYGQGRPNVTPYGRAGSIVTNAKAGESDHNFGLAVDVAFKNAKNQVSYGIGLYEQAAVIAKQVGLLWGGDWTSFQDRPHFYITKQMANQNQPMLSQYEGKIVYPLPNQNGAKHFLVKDGKPLWVKNELEFFATGFDFKDAIGVPAATILAEKQGEYVLDKNNPRVKQAINLFEFALAAPDRAKQLLADIKK